MLLIQTRNYRSSEGSDRSGIKKRELNLSGKQKKASDNVINLIIFLPKLDLGCWESVMFSRLIIDIMYSWT